MTASDTTTLTATGTAGATAKDVLGSRLGFKSARGRISAFRMKALANAAGVTMTLYLGERLMFADRQVPFVTGTGAFPSWLDHQVQSPVALGPAEIINLSFNNPTAAAVNINWEVEVVP